MSVQELTETVTVDEIATEEDSQEVMEVDEQPEAQRPDWLPEKFSSPEDMAKAYSELEKKLGTKPTQPKDLEIPAKVTEEVAESADSPKAILGQELFDKVSDHYQENGELSQELYEELAAKGLPSNVVDAFIEGQQVKAQKYETEVTSVVGGKEVYQQLQAWAVDNLSDAEKDAVNEAVTSGSVAKAQMVMQWLKGKYESTESNPPSLVEGEGNAPTGEGFANRDEYIHAISDKRYGSDPKYRREVDRKLELSTYFLK